MHARHQPVAVIAAQYNGWVLRPRPRRDWSTLRLAARTACEADAPSRARAAYSARIHSRVD